jgi:hypothetical protein
MKCHSAAESCGAFKETKQPCWAAKKKGGKCYDMDCKSCEVYISLGNCQKIKDKIVELTNNK